MDFLNRANEKQFSGSRGKMRMEIKDFDEVKIFVSKLRERKRGKCNVRLIFLEI